MVHQRHCQCVCEDWGFGSTAGIHGECLRQGHRLWRRPRFCQKALGINMSSVKSDTRPRLNPSRELQKKLTAPIIAFTAAVRWRVDTFWAHPLWSHSSPQHRQWAAWPEFMSTWNKYFPIVWSALPMSYCPLGTGKWSPWFHNCNPNEGLSRWSHWTQDAVVRRRMGKKKNG